MRADAYIGIFRRICFSLALGIGCGAGFSQVSTNQVSGVTNAESVINAAAQPGGELWRAGLKDLLRVRYLQTAQVSLTGSAAKLGLDEKDLREFVNLKQKNLFTGYEIKNLPKEAQFKLDEDFDIKEVTGVNKDEWAMIYIRVWTAGDDYPVAYHLKLTLGRLGGGRHGYEDEILGVSSAKNLLGTRRLKDSITEMMEKAAAQLMKLQGKL